VDEEVIKKKEEENGEALRTDYTDLEHQWNQLKVAEEN
jgi:hypothetical protein